MINVVIECLLILDLLSKIIIWKKSCLSFCIYFRELWYLIGQNVDEITKTSWSHVNVILKLNHIDYRYPVWILDYYKFHQLVELKYRHVIHSLDFRIDVPLGMNVLAPKILTKPLFIRVFCKSSISESKTFLLLFKNTGLNP